jgi:hypothetical protein
VIISLYSQSEQASAEYGNADKTFRYASTVAEPFCFNQTKYFVRNGTTLNNVDGELEMYILIMKLFLSNLVMYYVHLILIMTY